MIWHQQHHTDRPFAERFVKLNAFKNFGGAFGSTETVHTTRKTADEDARMPKRMSQNIRRAAPVNPRLRQYAAVDDLLCAGQSDAKFLWIFHTAAQIALDYLKEILDTLGPTNPDPLLEKRLVDTSRDFERYVQEGLQKDASQ